MKGDIIPSDVKWIYDWLGWESTCPQDFKTAIEGMQPGETLTVLVNSGGGDVKAGQEIFSILYGRTDVEIRIQSIAGSAASVIAMAGRCEISPVGVIMIHNVAMRGASGDYHDMEKNAEILRQMNAAMAEAYIAKTGKTEAEILELMDRETWITARQALELGFVDAISGPGTPSLVNASIGMRLTDEIRQQVMEQKKQKDLAEEEKQKLLGDLDLYGI